MARVSKRLASSTSSGAISTHSKRRQLSDGQRTDARGVVSGDDDAPLDLSPTPVARRIDLDPVTPKVAVNRPFATPRRRRTRGRKRAKIGQAVDVLYPHQLSVTLRGRLVQGFHHGKKEPRSQTRAYRGPLGGVNVNPTSSERWVSHKFESFIHCTLFIFMSRAAAPVMFNRVLVAFSALIVVRQLCSGGRLAPELP